MYLEEFSELNEKYPQFFDLYKRFFIERFIYNNSLKSFLIINYICSMLAILLRIQFSKP